MAGINWILNTDILQLDSALHRAGITARGAQAELIKILAYVEHHLPAQ